MSVQRAFLESSHSVTILSVAISPTILSVGATTLTCYAMAAAPVAARGRKATITAL